MKHSGKKWTRVRVLFVHRDGQIETDGSGHRGRAHRAKRRAALATTWSRVMAEVSHPIAGKWKAFFAKRLPEITGQSPRLRKGVPGWKSFKKRQRSIAA